MRPAVVRAKLRAVRAQILAIAEAQPRPATGWIPPRQPGLPRPCPRCGRKQPAGQSPEALREYAKREPAAVLYTRTDGTVRAHSPGCDLLPHAPVRPDPAPAKPELTLEEQRARMARHAGFSGHDSPAEPKEAWSDRRSVPAPLYTRRGFLTATGFHRRAAIVWL